MDLATRYRAAEALSQWREQKLVRNADVFPRWLSGGRFWYERDTSAGTEWRLVDVAARTTAPLFDHAALARALAARAGSEVDAAKLPIERVRVGDDGAAIGFFAFGRGWRWVAASGKLEEAASAGRPDLLRSPDGRLAAYCRSHNLWVKDLGADADRALTTDGAAFYAYGLKPDCRRRMQPQLPPPPAPPDALWSPDGQRLLTIQTDDRQVASLPVIDYVPADGTLRPRIHEVRAAWPDDPGIPEFRLVAIDVATGRQVAARYPRLPAVRMFDTPIAANLAWWSADSRRAWFVDIERGERTARVVEFDATTGACRTLFEESCNTFLDLGYNVYAPAQVVVLPATDELVWYSERSGWAQLYLYDLRTGALKRPVTSGEFVVREILHVDEARRELWLHVMGRRKDRHPYYREVCRVHLDSGELTPLTDEDADHGVWRAGEFGLVVLEMYGSDSSAVAGVSPGGEYFVDTASRVDTLPVSTLRDRDGQVLLELERAEADGLPEGLQWPEVVQTRAADGQTDIYGLMVRPQGMEAGRRYPVVNLIYGGPQIDAVPKTSFNGLISTGNFVELLMYSALGFVAVMFEGRGTPGRSKAFHDESYGRVETASNTADHAAGIRELAARHDFIDLERVGITGFSGGGYATAGAMLRHADLYRVGIAGAGNYDQRMFWSSWGERYQGLVDGDNYALQTHVPFADRLRGRILFLHGLLDPGCHAAALFQLTEALSKANRDFDLLLLPKAAHAGSGYATRRQWDYFVRHLAGLVPPADVAIETGSDIMMKRLMERQRVVREFLAKQTGAEAT